jgi:hypothetical protein
VHILADCTPSAPPGETAPRGGVVCVPDPTKNSSESFLVGRLGEILVHPHDKCSQSKDVVHFEALVSVVVCINCLCRNLAEFRSDVDEVVSLLIYCLSRWADELQLLIVLVRV